MKSISRFKITPAKLENDIVVNEILLKRILTKLKKVKNVRIEYGESAVTFHYETKTGKGHFLLRDIKAYGNVDELPITNLLEGLLTVHD